MSRKNPPDPSVHTLAPRFSELSHSGQLALAAWAVLLKSAPPADGDRLIMPSARYGRAVGDIALTVGLRGRKKMNYAQVSRPRRRPRQAVKS